MILPRRLCWWRPTAVALAVLLVLTACVPTVPPAPTPGPLEVRLVAPLPGAVDTPVFGPIAFEVVGLPRAAPDGSSPVRATLERSFTIDPPAPGKLDWDGDRLLFRPNWPGLAPGVTYEVSLAAGPAAPRAYRFTTAGRLAVSAVVPEDGASDVALDAALYVQFNRPVAPLTTLEQAAQPTLLQFDPPVEGAGRWINTGLYGFTPKGGWRPSTTYRVTVPTTVADALGGALSAEFQWSFTTLAPAVAATDPKPNARLVGPDAAIRVVFNQPVDRASAEQRFELLPSGGAPLEGAFEWPDDRTLVFHPARPLAPDVRHEARIAPGVSAPGGQAQTTAEHGWVFFTAPAPRVLRSSPSEGEQAARPGQVELYFSSPMDRDDVKARLQVQPRPEYPPSLYWNDDDTHLSIAGAFRPSTRYTFTLPGSVRDRFGRPLGDGFRLTFTTAPSPPQAWLVSPGLVGTFNAYARPQVVVRTTNVTGLSYTLERLDEQKLLTLLADPKDFADDRPLGEVVRSWSLPVQSELNVARLTTADLVDAAGQPLPPGYYRLTVQPRETEAGRQRALFVVTRTSLTVKQSERQALVWAVDLASGEPLANLPVRVLHPKRGPLGQGRTDATGRLLLDLPAPTSPSDAYLPVFALADRAGDAAISSSDWSAGIGPWDFGLPQDLNPVPWVAHLFTDRPIYRPGQTVHLKGILRADDDARYSLPPADLQATWRVMDSQGREAASGRATLGEFGTFSADIELSDEAATGDYSVLLLVGTQGVGSTGFQVAEYRRPEFEVNVAADRPAVVAGEDIPVSVLASYYFGRLVAGAATRWRVTSEPWSFTWKDEPGYRFGDFEYDEGQPPAAPTGPRAEGRGTTEADGSLRFSVPTDLSKDRTSQLFTVEATVTDANDQEVSARIPVVVHKAGLYVGLKPAQYVATAGREQSIALVTLDPGGQPLAGVPVRVRVLRRTWLNVRERDPDGELRWRSRPEDTPVTTLDARSGADGRATVAFTPGEGGQYRVVAEARDAAGNVASSALSVWAAGPGYVPWRMDGDDRLQLQADRTEYQPGDVARVLVPAPVADALALVTVERGKLISSRVERLAGNSPVLEIPLGPEHVPNAYVSVVLLKGGSPPVFRVGYVELPVSTASRRLQVVLEPDRRELEPRETVTFAIRTLDAEGRGVPAEVSLALVDAAVLALADERAGDPVQAFWHRRGLGVRTGAGQAVSIDRLNETFSSGRKGGGGGEAPTVRREFPDTAFWQPSLRTDQDGRARVAIKLPDNLTTWRLSALAVTRDTRLGRATSDVVAAKQLLVRPVLPRFLVAGDRARIGAVVHNSGQAPLQVPATLRVTGLTLEGDPARTVDLPPGGQARVDWSVAVPRPASAGPSSAGEAVLHFEAGAAGGVQDAVELRLPVLEWGAAATVATAGEVADAVAEVVELPHYAERDRGKLTIEVAPSLAAAVRYGLRSVEEFEYESVEQTVSRFLPRLALYRAIDQLGLGDPYHLKGDLPGLVNRSIQRLYRYQHGDGGWGWWRDDASQPYLTAYTLFGLVEARKAGFAVDRGVTERAERYLRDWLNADPGPFGLSVRAYVLYVLGVAGTPDASRAAALYDRRAELGIWAKAYLAQALAQSNPADTRVGGLIAELTDAAVVSSTGTHWEETKVNPWSLTTSARTTATVLDALVRLRPDHPLVPAAVRWLMVARRDGHWESTQETALSLLALTDYLAASRELGGAFRWTLDLNGRELRAGQVDASTLAEAARLEVPVQDLQVGANRIDLARSPASSGRLYYTIHFQYYPPADEIPAEARGFTLVREYFPFEGEGGPLESARVGDLLRVKLTVLAPSELHHLIVEDPLPAGLEALDPSLKVTTLAAGEALQPEPGRFGFDSWWRWPRWTHVDLRDRQVALFASYLPKGTHEYVYVARAAIPGTYRVRPASAYEQYFPEVFARTDGRVFTVEP